MNLFGKKKAAPAPNPAEAIMKLRGTMETLEKRQQFIEKKAEGMVVEAKQKMAKKDKNGALYSLKRKKMYEAEINKIQGAMMNLQSQMMSLESAAGNMEVFNAMRTGAQAMANVRGAMDIDKVDDLMDDIREEMETANHISDAISRPVDDSLATDDEDLLAELDALEDTELETKLTDAPVVTPGKVGVKPTPAEPMVDLPQVPTKPLPAVTEAEDEELRALRELESSMAV